MSSDKAVLEARSKLAQASKRGKSPEEAAAARRQLAEAKIAKAVRECLAEAPPLTEDQLSRLASLLRPVEQ